MPTSLTNWMAHRKRETGEKSLQLEEINRVFFQVIEGLKYLHTKGICHRDLTPNNILIDHNTLYIPSFLHFILCN